MCCSSERGKDTQRKRILCTSNIPPLFCFYTNPARSRHQSGASNIAASHGSLLLSISIVRANRFDSYGIFRFVFLATFLLRSICFSIYSERMFYKFTKIPVSWKHVFLDDLHHERTHSSLIRLSSRSFEMAQQNYINCICNYQIKFIHGIARIQIMIFDKKCCAEILFVSRTCSAPFLLCVNFASHWAVVGEILPLSISLSFSISFFHLLWRRISLRIGFPHSFGLAETHPHSIAYAFPAYYCRASFKRAKSTNNTQ